MRWRVVVACGSGLVSLFCPGLGLREGEGGGGGEAGTVEDGIL